MIGLLTALGVFVLIPSAILIKDAISSITADALSRAFGLFILEFALVFAAVGAACLAIVWLLFLGDKVGRMLAVILCASIALAELLNSTRTGWDTTALVVSIGCVLALVALPDSRAFFSSDDPRPVGVVVTTALLAVLAWSWALAGIMLLPLGRYEGKDVAYGILFLAGAVVATIVNRQLRLGNQTARIVASVVLVAVSVVDLLVEHTAAGAVVMVGLAAGAIGTLWIPESSRNFFARPGAGLPAGFVWPWHVRTGARGFEATGPGLTRFRAAALQTQRRPVGGPAAYGLVGGVLLLAVVLSIWSYASAGSALALGNSGSFGSQDYATTTIPSYGTTTTLPTVSEEVTHTWTITEADPNGNTFTVTLAVGQPEPYNTSNPPNAAQIDGGGGAITAGQGCSLSQGSDAVVPALITANNPNPSNTMNEGITFSGFGGNSIPGIPGTGLDWEAVYGGSNGSATCDDQNSFGVGFSNVDNSSRQYGFFDITGYYGGSASTSTILGDTIIDVPASQSETFNDGTSENFTVTNVTGPGVVQSSDGWEFDLAGATPPSNN